MENTVCSRLVVESITVQQNPHHRFKKVDMQVFMYTITSYPIFASVFF